MKSDESEEGLPIQFSDFPLVATLVTLGFNFTALDKTDQARVVFTFLQTEKLQEAISKYWNGELRVEPKAFSSIQRQLKAQIRNNIGVSAEEAQR